MPSQKKQYPYFYFLRILAVFFVFYNHTVAFHHCFNAEGPVPFYYGAMSAVTKMAVPLFFMVSGALLLGRREDIGSVLKKRVAKYVLLLFLFTLPRILKRFVAYLRAGEAFPVLTFAQEFLSNGEITIASYWFLYAYIGFLLALPYLQRIAQQMTRQDVSFLLALHVLLCSLLPMVNLLLSRFGYSGAFSLSRDMELPLALSQIFFFPLMGYYLDKKLSMEKLTAGKVAALGAVTVAGIAISCLCMEAQKQLSGASSAVFQVSFDYGIAIFVFVLVKWLVVRFGGDRSFPLAGKIASLTFGMYLLEYYVGAVFTEKYLTLTAGSPLLLSGILWSLFVMVTAGLGAFVLKKLPVFRKLL